MSKTEPVITQQKYEYLAIEVVSIKLLGASSTTFNLENKDLKKALSGKTLTNGLNYLASLGWELIAAANGFSVGSNTLYLKQLINKNLT